MKGRPHNEGQILRQNAVYNELLFQESHFSTLVLEPETGVVVDCNQAAIKLYGLFKPRRAEWEKYSGERFADLKRIQPTLVVNGIHDEMIPVSNSYWLSENLPMLFC